MILVYKLGRLKVTQPGNAYKFVNLRLNRFLIGVVWIVSTIRVGSNLESISIVMAKHAANHLPDRVIMKVARKVSQTNSLPWRFYFIYE